MTQSIQSGQKKALVICGMHRSGSSAIARTYSLLGATLPANLVPPNEGNPEGHWEPQRVLDLNDDMLRAAGSDLYSVTNFDDEWLTGLHAEGFVKRAREVLEQEYSDSRFIVVKDPRICLFLPIWDEALRGSGFTVHYTVPVRSQRAVADSLRRRHLKSIPYDGWPPPRGELVWLRYTSAAYTHTRAKSRLILLADDFFADWKQQAVLAAKTFGFKWPRFTPQAEAEIHHYLTPSSGGYQPQPRQRETSAGVRVPDSLTSSDLAEEVFWLLRDQPGETLRLEALINEYSQRMIRSDDILVALESTFPLIWEYYQKTQSQTLLLTSGLEQQERLTKTIHRMWEQLTQSSRKNSLLDRATLEIEDLRKQLAAADRQQRERDDQIRRLQDSLRQQAIIVSRAVQEKTRNAQILQEVFESSSWRLTAPLRFVVTKLRSALGRNTT